MEPSQGHVHGLGGTGLSQTGASANGPKRQKDLPCAKGPLSEFAGGVTFSVRAIGIVHTPFRSGCPAPKHFARQGRGTLEVLPEFKPSLCGLRHYSHLWLLLYLGGSQIGQDVRRRPFNVGERDPGDTFGPSLQNVARLSLVKLVSMEGTLLRLEGLDADDGTPVLDILPLQAASGAPGQGPRASP